MKKSITLIALIAICVGTGARADISFSFKIPAEPATPVITNVSNSAVVNGASKFTVYAQIEGATQQKACCGAACDRTDCELYEWYLTADTTVSPNPPCIPNENGETGMPDASCKISGIGNPKVFYYKDGGVGQPGSAAMRYDADKDLFTADIPVDPSWVEGDTIYYYVVAADSAGNVTSMLPDSGKAPCESTSIWDTNYETPAGDNCSAQVNYEQCGMNIAGSPSCAGTADFAVNDPEGDTCGEPDESGNQSLVTGGENVDILGFSAGAGLGYWGLPNDNVVCTRMNLKGATPTSSSGPIEFYQTAFYNPGISDPNPADTYLPNVFVITYAPEAAGADKNLVSVLWDGECYTNPNTLDPLTCRIVVGSEGEAKLKIGYSDHNLTFIAKNALTTGTGSKTILDATTNSVKMRASTGELNLIGSTLYWTVDTTTGMNLLKRNYTATVAQEVAPAAPLFKSTTCKAGGAGDSAACAKSTTQPDSNQCEIVINPSPDSFATKYKVYHNTKNDRSTAEYLPDFDITTDPDQPHTITYTVPQASLDGGTHYFFFSSVGGELETSMTNWTASEACTVEDWTPPAAPSGLSCATPDGREKQCVCSWGIPDSSVYGYNVDRDNTQINSSTVLGTTYTDDDSSLVNGATHTYRVQAVDIGGNISAWSDPVTCFVEDLEPPSKVDSLGVSLQIGSGDPCTSGSQAGGMDFSWSPVSDPDTATYNLYECYKDSTKPDSCQAKTGTSSANGFELINTQAKPVPAATMYYSSPDDAYTSIDWCFYVEACDNCKAEGTCPSRPGMESNCSAFDTSSLYTKCIQILIEPVETNPTWPPAQPDGKNATITVLPEGNSCKIEWNRICSSYDTVCGVFPDCDNPTALELLGYKIMRAPAVDDDCSTTGVPSPNEATPVATVGISTNPSYTDTGLTNGAKYCYLVYGYNAYGKYSIGDSPEPVECTPADTQPPTQLVIDKENSLYNTDDGACNMKWNKGEDKDSLSYSVYRCTGDLTTCNSASKFTAIDESLGLTEPEYSDAAVSTSVKNYTYCVTAKDAAGNENTRYDAADTDNCFTCCTTCGSTLPSYQSPATVTAVNKTSSTLSDVTINWAQSPDDDGYPYDAGEGYNFYVCTSAEKSSCTKKIIELSPVQMYGVDFDISQCILSKYRTTGNEYYIGVSYHHLSTYEDSPIIVSSLPSDTLGKINIYSLLCDYCANYISLSGEGPNDEFRKYTITSPSCSTPDDCLKSPVTYTYQPITNARVEIIDSADSDSMLYYIDTRGDGRIPGFHLCEEAGHTYAIRLRLPLSEYSTGCDSKTADYCYKYLKTGISYSTPSSSAPISVPDIPLDSTAGGGDIGNPNCDNSVNLKDILLIKNAYGTSSGDTCYRAWADFNNDGSVNLTDILKIKDYYGGKIKDTGNASSAVLCASKAPLPACCSTKTCF